MRTITISCGTVRCWRCWRASSSAAQGLCAVGGQVNAESVGACAEEATPGERYRRLRIVRSKIESLFVDLFLEAHETPPESIVLDLDATDDPLHERDQEGRFFHGYYGGYCYLPLYVFAASICWQRSCAGRTSTAARKRGWRRDGSGGGTDPQRWPKVRITLQADSGFARELMAWCESNAVDTCLDWPRTRV
ncbi:MAG: transposase [Lysobacterales bacterium]